MIEVRFERDGRGRLSSFFASGHAQFAVDADDLVCAAVSAVLQAARLGLEAYAGPGLQVEQRPGRLHAAWTDAAREDRAVEAIAETARRSIEAIAAQYPEHVSLRGAESSPHPQHRGAKPGNYGHNPKESA